MPEQRIFTASWRTAIEAERLVQPVRISLGKPRWIASARAAAYPSVEALMPWGLLNADLDADEFRHRYLARLDSHAEAIADALAALRESFERPVLCCFERDPADCHRGTFATWWLEQTGEAIPEWVPTRPDPDAVQLTLDSKETP